MTGLENEGAKELAELAARVGEPDYERLMRLLIDVTPDFIAIKDGDGRWLLANRAGLALYHLEDQPWWGKTDAELSELCHPMYREGLRQCTETDELAWEQGALSRAVEIVPLPEGGQRVFDVYKMPVFEQSRRHVLIIVGRDITERAEAQERLMQLASTDELTGLLSRRRFLELAGQRLETWRDVDRQVALVLLDLDHFKQINDSYGHARGDQLLRVMAERLESLGAEVELLARLGGDEFAILLRADQRGGGRLTLQLEQIVQLAQEPFKIDQMRLWVSASMGVAFWPDDGENVAALITAADSAMYESKARGRNIYTYYNAELARQIRRKTRMLGALRESLSEGGFDLVYQVQQNARTMRISGVEALLRWTPREDDLSAGPGQFVPLLEENGLVTEVGDWVLEQACRQAMEWNEGQESPVGVCVNVSAIQLHAPGFAASVRDILARTGLPTELLELEITETALVSDPDMAAQSLAAVKAMGVRLALDDFGTGYSSLSYLKRFSFDRLKIDQSFVHDLLHDRDDLEIVKAMIAMGRALGMEVVAEGVESVAQRDLLDTLGCDIFQGYLIGRPCTAEALRSRLDVSLL